MTATRMMLVGAVAAMAFAISAVPSVAAKKKAKAICGGGLTCSTNCKGSACEVKSCGADGKLYTPILTRVCKQPDCPAKC